MRRYVNPEPEPAADATAEELRRTLNLLLPIRRQRLNRSEREQREREQALRELEEQTARAGEQLHERQLGYRQLRAGFAQQNCGVRQASYLLERSLEQEQQALKKVHSGELKMQELNQAQLAQQQRVAEARQQTKLRQREVEKLEFLLQQEVSE
ncbi:type III secretion protein [Kalamiella sp. sgz302252]|uniref:type III secretion protein n=1 Tax=Pantoea sp. sgz302252 TaxID=3341827 RepID=UPI0036D3B0E4